MQDFINMAVSQLGINEGQAKSATGGVLNMLQGQMGGGDFQKLVGMLRGSQDLMKGVAGGGGSSGGGGGGGIAGALGGMLGGKSGGGGGLGNLAGMASGLLGGNKGGGVGLNQMLGLLGNSGLSGDKASGFLKMFIDYVGGKGGGDLLKGVMGNTDIAKLLG